MKWFKRSQVWMLLVVMVLGTGIMALVPSVSAQDDDPQTVVVYCGRSRNLVEPVFSKFTEKTGIKVLVRYGSTSEMAAALLEEGDRTLADVFFAQDAGALGALTKADRFQVLPEALLGRVDARFRAKDGTWIGVTGRARTIVFNTNAVAEDEAPDSVMELTDSKWKGRVGWAPTNGSFQAFVTAMRAVLGEGRTEAWLKGMIANGVKEYSNNTSIVRAAGAGEVDVGLVNHYYLLRFKAEDKSFPAANKFTRAGDPGSLVNIAGCGILAGGRDEVKRATLALELISYMLSESAQQQFADETHEYPLIDGVEADAALATLESLNPPDIDLSDLDDLEGTLELLREVGALP